MCSSRKDWVMFITLKTAWVTVASLCCSPAAEEIYHECLCCKVLLGCASFSKGDSSVTRLVNHVHEGRWLREIYSKRWGMTVLKSIHSEGGILYFFLFFLFLYIFTGLLICKHMITQIQWLDSQNGQICIERQWNCSAFSSYHSPHFYTPDLQCPDPQPSARDNHI